MNMTQHQKKSKIIGIDLGTTNSCVAISLREGRTNTSQEVIANAPKAGAQRHPWSAIQGG